LVHCACFVLKQYNASISSRV